MKQKKLITIAVSVVVVIALVVGGILLYRSSDTNKKIDAFENTVNTLKDLRLQYSTGSYNAAYESLVEECTLCLTNKTTSDISSLTDRIKELKLNIITENKQIADFKTQLATFQNAVSLYVIAGNDKTEYNRLLAELEKFITNSDVNGCNTISKQLTTLLSKLKTINEQDAANANNTDKQYKEELEKIQKKLNDNEKKLSDNEKKLKESQQKKAETPKQKKSDPPEVIYVVPGDCEYIIPDSSIRYLTDSDLCYMGKDDLCYARNEIYARHGRKFDLPKLSNYFNSKSWYNGRIAPKDFNDSCLSDIENANIALIQKYEAKFK